MSKRKVVISVPMDDAKKRSTALQVVVGFPGVVSAEIKEGDKSQIVFVCGERVDTVKVTKLLRKKVSVYANIVELGPVQENNETDVEDDDTPVPTNVPCPSHQHQWLLYDCPYDVVYYHDPCLSAPNIWPGI